MSESPNVILILADDMGVGDLSCLNGGLTRTPNLDRLKDGSVWFPQAYSASCVCAPARAALLTGRYPHRTGAVTLNMRKYPELTRIRLDETTMADVFRANGYVTGLVGKWHAGLGPDYHPLARGFDEFEGFCTHLDVPSYYDYQLDVQGEYRGVKDRYLTEDLSARAIAFVRRHRDVPFFLHLAHYAPHRPLGAPEELVEHYASRGLDRQIATVYAMIEVMDKGIGQLVDELERLALTERTIVIFASDNGPDPLAGERFTLGLRGGKYMVYEGGVRVPFMLRWPGTLTPGCHEETIHFTDVLPTLADLCGLEYPRTLDLDGRSFAPALRGTGTTTPRPLFWQWNRAVPMYSHNAAVRDGRWKLVRPWITSNVPEGESDAPPALYDLAADPAEATDLAACHPARVADMNAALSCWSSDVERDRVRPFGQTTTA